VKTPTLVLTRRSLIRQTVAAGIVASALTTLTLPTRNVGAKHASPVANATDTFPRLDITSTDAGLTLPAQVEAGRYLVTIENQATLGESAPNFILLKDGETAEGIINAPYDPAVSMPDWVYASTVVPSPITPLGTTAQAIVDFAPGRYAVYGEPYQPLTELEVISGPSGSEIEPVGETDITIGDGVLTGVPAQVTTGEHIWRVSSLGDVPHRFQLYSYPEPVTRDQIVAAYTHLLEGTEPEPGLPDLGLAVQLGGLGPMSGGLTGWPVVDLIPGQYIAMCGMQEGETAIPHGLQGEVTVFTVVEA
jgi:hypothetical protein